MGNYCCKGPSTHREEKYIHKRPPSRHPKRNIRGLTNSNIKGLYPVNIENVNVLTELTGNAIKFANGITYENNIKNSRPEEFKKINLNNLIIPAKVIDVYDGDTCTMGFSMYGVYLKKRCRLRWVNTEEIKQRKKGKTEEQRIALKRKALDAKHRLIELLTDVFPQNDTQCDGIIKRNTKIVYVKFFKDDPFGRGIAEIYLDKEMKRPVHQILIDEGHSELYTKYEK